MLQRMPYLISMRKDGVKGTVPRQDILIVVHGPGRGRTVPTGAEFMRRVKQRNPGFAGRIRFHRTGADVINLDNVALIAFWLGDPLRQIYPECYAEAAQIAAAAARLGLRSLNAPDALSNTSKSSQALIWTRDRVPSARSLAVRSREEVRAAIQQVGLPCIVRLDEIHCQRNVFIVRNERDVSTTVAAMQFPAVVSQMIDVREQYRISDPDRTSLFSRYHHKARAFVFNGNVIASHLFFSSSLIVGMSNSTFALEDTRYRKLACKIGLRRRDLNDMIAADIAYFRTSVTHADVLVGAVAALGLDFAALDYSLLPGGQPMIWEANPFFHLPGGDKSVLSAARGAVARVDASFDWMADNLEAALDQACHETTAA